MHNINAHTKFGENALIFGENALIFTLYCPETKILIERTTNREMDTMTTNMKMDNQNETIIPCNYHVAGYKNIQLFSGQI